MNEMRVSEPEQVAPPQPPAGTADPLRRWTLVILVLCVLLFGWTLIADRLTPYTSDASVRTFVVRTVPEVSGKVIEVGVRDNQIVRTGDVLYRIDPTPLLQALALNLGWAHTLRRRIAAAASMAVPAIA
jgi:multidrug resistance efflux pump